MRFVGALEEVLDPIVAILDSLPAYLIADYAPHDMLELLTAWLGLELDETQPHEHRRDLIRHAAELGRRRGTARGLELALRLAFPGVPLRVEDGGGVVWATESGSLPRIGPPEIVVYCDEPLPEERLTAMARFIERAKPVHVGYRLRVKTPKKPKGATKEEEAAPEPPPASGPEPPPASGAEPPTEGTPEAPEEPS
jgi:phage tail-like protein